MKKYTLISLFIGISASFWANAQQEQLYSFIKPIKLNEAINTSCDESSPVLSKDGKILYFSRVLCPTNIGGETAGQDIYMSQKDESGNWKKAVNIGAPLNNKFENAPVSLSDDDKTLFLQNLYRGGDKMAAGVSYAVKKGDTLWDFPKSIHLKGFQFRKNSFVGFHVSRNGKHLFISRFKKDSTDAEDLFVSHKDEKGNWSEPVNLGESINSVGYETSPFLLDDDSTIFFSSNGWGGYGDADIFVSKRLDDTWKKWSRPQNLGNSVNGKGFDGYFTTVANGDCYFVSGDDPSASGDIYYTKKIRSNNTLTVNITDAKSGKPVGVATVTSTIRDGSKEVLSKTLAENGVANIKISSQPKKYFFVVHAEGYVSADQLFDVNALMENRDTSFTLTMTPIEVGQTVRLNNIFFETGKATLLEESNSELDVLVELLQENATMEILISGHTDNKGNAKLNQKLSEDRVKSVDAYLVSKGIETKRLTYKGFGSTKPVADNKTEEGRAKNRRVEFKILKK
jgi:outer membrane protein OmpA-like peptidoglycan-associated protein